ncbi:unnamed protein product, partial [Phaeothamnion confervicola]
NSSPTPSTAPKSAVQASQSSLPIAARGAKSVVAKKEDIRASPWQLNLLARQLRGLTVPEAVANLMYAKKKHAATYLRLIENTCNLADIRHRLPPDQLWVSQLYVTQGRRMKRWKYMGKGRAGTGYLRFGHLNLTLSEMDFDALAAANPVQRRKWERLKAEVRAD